MPTLNKPAQTTVQVLKRNAQLHRQKTWRITWPNVDFNETPGVYGYGNPSHVNMQEREITIDTDLDTLPEQYRAHLVKQYGDKAERARVLIIEHSRAQLERLRALGPMYGSSEQCMLYLCGASEDGGHQLRLARKWKRKHRVGYLRKLQAVDRFIEVADGVTERIVKPVRRRVLGPGEEPSEYELVEVKINDEYPPMEFSVSDIFDVGTSITLNKEPGGGTPKRPFAPKMLAAIHRAQAYLSWTRGHAWRPR